jgi:hypothetical protein
VCAGSEGGEADDCDEQGQQQQDQVDRYYLHLVAAEMDADGEGLDESVADCRGAIEVGVVLDLGGGECGDVGAGDGEPDAVGAVEPDP